MTKVIVNVGDVPFIALAIYDVIMCPSVTSDDGTSTVLRHL